MNLISREAAIEAISYHEDIDNEAYKIVKRILTLQEAIPAVPLDKLCEWLVNSFSEPPCCTLENVRCKMECRGFTQMDYSECWRHVLIEWMEGLDAN